MRLTRMSSGCALVLMSLAWAACSRTDEREVRSRPYVPTAAEQRRIDERRAEERLARERREEDRRAEERRELDRRAEERAKAEERARPRERAIGGGPVDHVVRTGPAWASESIALARCSREVKCNRVGADGKYPSRGACVAELKREVRSDLQSNTCGHVRDKELNDCLQAIRAEQCGNTLDMDGAIRLKACRPDNICTK
jgi:hypothetical protein